METPAVHAIEVLALVEPTLPDVLATAARIRPHLSPTRLRQSPAVGEVVGADVYLKPEFHLPTGALKVRGGVFLVSQLRTQECGAGVIAAWTLELPQRILRRLLDDLCLSLMRQSPPQSDFCWPEIGSWWRAPTRRPLRLLWR
jgi:hypothetical protein